MSLSLPAVGDNALAWLRAILPHWVRWNAEVQREQVRTQTVLLDYGFNLTILTPAQATALLKKSTNVLYACSGDPSGGAGGSGFYKWDGVAWSKFA